MAKNRKPVRRGSGNQMQAAMARAVALREEMEAVQAEVAVMTASGEAGAGKVQVTVNGAGDVVEVKFDPSVLSPENAEILSEMVVDAAMDAKEKMATITEEKMGRYANMLNF